MTGVDVERTKALEAGATPGEWVVAGTDESGNAIVGGFCHSCTPPCNQLEYQIATAGSFDAEFIAHARTAVPALIAAVERAQAQQARIAELLGVVLPHTAINDKTRVALMQLFQIHDEIKALETP
ncbi:hypothetical protein [Rhodococcus erythropolis]|uniref:hypothetical protein n=1 Tax=Rhodococcus erythropolis TaxID=1833 RepID=UPI0036708F00